ncbi:hypothetical protein [Pontibacter fetidus]|uniref:STAS/SEC14 domain-containing protein n=1 Tax=Pontibacter fetidus TaxID=2700082 RepID=A0A6B2H613_9BACT|nr:hypothetical protein [Pontibacter fetidus]NDK55270.1 hypothetical protein [Pontibacter fetidus]
MEKAKGSRAVGKIVLQTNCVSIFFDEPETLTIQWQRQIDYEERKEIFLWARQFSMDHKVKNWLIDDEELYIMTTQEKEWIENEWPELAAEAGLAKIVVYLPDYNFSSIQTLTDFTRRAQQNYNRLGVTQHEVFTDYQTALTWLAS